MEVDDSPRAVSLWDRVDSTCAQVVHSNLEVPSNQLVAAPAEKETQEQDEKFGKQGSCDLSVSSILFFLQT